MKYLKEERIDFQPDQSPVYLFGLAKRRVKRKLNEAANKPASNKIGDFAAAKEVTDVIERIKNVRMAGSTDKIWTACNAVIMIFTDNVVLHVHHADFNAPCKGIMKADVVCTGCSMSVPGEFVYSFEVLVRDVEDGSARIKLKVNDKGGKAIFGMPAHEPRRDRGACGVRSACESASADVRQGLCVRVIGFWVNRRPCCQGYERKK